MGVKAVKASILRAIKKVQKQEWKLVCNWTISKTSRQCCPVAALLIDCADEKIAWGSTKKVCERAAELLKIKPTDVEAFMCGFDRFSKVQTFRKHDSTDKWTNGVLRLEGADLKSAKVYYDLGLELRTKLKPGKGSVHAL